MSGPRQQDARLSELERRIGHAFADRELLREAMTHASSLEGSKKRRSYDRLEFLGDRVLGLAVAELLLERAPKASEGALARRFNRLVRKETCARVARSLKLGQLLLLSSAENDSGGRDKDTILADAAEALLAAIFLEAGFLVARDVVRTLWAPLLEGMPETVADSKSMLQEWAQGRALPTPTYREIARSGPDHDPEFCVAVELPGLAPAEGRGRSKRSAEKAAAIDCRPDPVKTSASPDGCQ